MTNNMHNFISITGSLLPMLKLYSHVNLTQQAQGPSLVQD